MQMTTKYVTRYKTVSKNVVQSLLHSTPTENNNCIGHKCIIIQRTSSCLTRQDKYSKVFHGGRGKSKDIKRGGGIVSSIPNDNIYIY